jgi:hypothetical protein
MTYTSFQNFGSAVPASGGRMAHVSGRRLLSVWCAAVVLLIMAHPLSALDVTRLDGAWIADSDMTWNVMISSDSRMSRMAPDELAGLKPLVYADLARASVVVRGGRIVVSVPGAIPGIDDPVRNAEGRRGSRSRGVAGLLADRDVRTGDLDVHDGVAMRHHQLVLDADGFLRVTTCIGDHEVRVLVFRKAQTDGGGR